MAGRAGLAAGLGDSSAGDSSAAICQYFRGSGSVLLLWSIVALVIVAGGGLFTYSVVINLRGGRRDRRRPPTDDRRNLPARQMPLPAGPMVGGQPVRGPMSGGGYPDHAGYPDHPY